MRLLTKKESACSLGVPSPGIEKLKLLTKKMDFANFSNHFGRMLEYTLEKGAGYSVGLMKETGIAVAKTYFSKGSEFPKHAHVEWELLVIYQGKLQLCVGEDKKLLKEKDFYYIEPRVPHGGIFLEETMLIAITIPGASDFPDGV